MKRTHNKNYPFIGRVTVIYDIYTTIHGVCLVWCAGIVCI